MSIYFFTHPDALQPQTPQQTYGPVQGSEETQYRVTALFSAPSEQKAYAVCNGKVFAQEVNGRINLVLKPTQQPKGLYAPVRYYIYKGLRKASLVDPNDATRIAPLASSQLTAKIHLSQERLNQARKLPPAPPSVNAVGLNLTANAAAPDQVLDTALLDDVFLRQDLDEFPSVRGGDDLGEFERADFGFEIVLDGIGDSPRLERVRNAATIMTAVAVPATAADKFRDLDSRERILDSIDPCAFFATFFFEGVQVKADGNAKFTLKRRDALYSSVLSKFGTKDVIHLDLRNEHDHSLDYYRDYTAGNGYAEFELALDQGASGLREYHTHRWPIFTIRATGFTSNDPKKPGTITLRLPGGPNTRPLIHLGQGYFFTGFRRTSQPPDTRETLRRVIEVQGDGFTFEVKFSVPKLLDNTIVPGLLNIRYLKHVGAIDPAEAPNSVALEAKHFFDNLFELTHLLDGDRPRIPAVYQELTAWHVIGSRSYVEAPSGPGTEHMAKMGVARDTSNVYFFACPEGSKLATGSTRTSSALESGDLAPSLEFGHVTSSDGSNRAVLTRGCFPGSLIDPASVRSLNLDMSRLVVLAVDKDELPAIATATASFERAFDKRLALRNGVEYLNSSAQPDGMEYDLAVAGYKFGADVRVDVASVLTSAGTPLKVRCQHTSPRDFSTHDGALNLSGLSGVKQNRRHFSRSRTQPDFDWSLRGSPGKDQPLKARTQGWVREFHVLGKVQVKSDPTDWYLVETQSAFRSKLGEAMKVLPSKSLVWIGKGDGFYPVASFEKFVCDLVRLNASIDAQQINIDRIQERITRLRQMTKEEIENPGDPIEISLSGLFDEIIDSTAPTPPAIKRLSDIRYDAGTLENVVDSAGDEWRIGTDMQMFRDYMGVEFGVPGQGVIVDLHHLFIGLDVLFHPDPNQWINPLVMFGNHPALAAIPHFYPLGNNIDMATWAGDIGAGPADYDSETDKSFEERIKGDLTLNRDQHTELIRDHYFKTRAKDDDLLPDVYAHVLHRQIETRLARNPEFRNLPLILYQFNQQGTSDRDRAAFREFLVYLKLDESQPLSTQARVDQLEASIKAFADLWWIRDNPVVAASLYAPGGGALDFRRAFMNPTISDYTRRFVAWLEKHRG